MIAVLQRVKRAEVRVAGRPPARIGHGLLVLLGVGRDDTEADAEWLARKCLGLRIFPDAEGRMNLSVTDVGGSLLVVSQFTLLGDCIKGKRPSWSAAADPAEAERLYEAFVARLRRGPCPVETGVFRAKMEVDLVNDGPVTLIVDSTQWGGRPSARKQGEAREDGQQPRGAFAVALEATLGARRAGPDTEAEAVRGERAMVEAGPAGEASLRLLAGGLPGPLILASRSPRRAMLLRMLGIEFEIEHPAEDGASWRGEEPTSYVLEQACRKARSVAHGRGTGVILGADTIVVLEGRVLEKPRDRREAMSFLEMLAGRTHEVLTGLCLIHAGTGRRVSGFERSLVTMSSLDPDTISAYVETGEPLDKAGAYGIQGIGGMLIERIEGCYFNVVGLPLARLRALMRILAGRLAQG